MALGGRRDVGSGEDTYCRGATWLIWANNGNGARLDTAEGLGKETCEGLMWRRHKGHSPLTVLWEEGKGEVRVGLKIH